MQFFKPLPSTSNLPSVSRQALGEAEGEGVGASAAPQMEQAFLQWSLPSGNLLQRLGLFLYQPHLLKFFPSTRKRVVESAQIVGADEGTAVGTEEGDADGTSVSPPHWPHETGQLSFPSGNLLQRCGFFLKNAHFISLFFFATKNLFFESSQQTPQVSGHFSGPSGNRSHLLVSLMKN